MNIYSDIFMDVSETLRTLGVEHGKNPFQYASWSSKNWMNTPGPIYGADTDNCWTGPALAPNNVQLDRDGREVIFRQPVNVYELRQVLQASAADPIDGYGANGDLHWTYEAIKEWWAHRYELEAEVDSLYSEEQDRGEKLDYNRYVGLSRWKDYIVNGMHIYLRVYSFFLEVNRAPNEGDTLPDL